jgi:hypothetical protein
MYLHVTDFHLVSARLELKRGNMIKAKGHLKSAGELIKTTGYYRRAEELKELKKLAGIKERTLRAT